MKAAPAGDLAALLLGDSNAQLEMPEHGLGIASEFD